MATRRTVRIHLPWTALIVPLLLFFCVTPLATAGRAWLIAYVLPAFALVAVVYGGTTATASHLSARWLRGRTRLAWDELHQLEFPGQRWAVAVTTSGGRVLLPGVRPADLPRIVAVAGGRLFLARRAAPQDPADGARTETEAEAQSGAEPQSAGVPGPEAGGAADAAPEAASETTAAAGLTPELPSASPAASPSEAGPVAETAPHPAAEGVSR